MPEIGEHATYEDWLDSRYGRYMGLSICGVRTRLVTVPIKQFVQWCDGLQISPTERALDAFALFSKRESVGVIQLVYFLNRFGLLAHHNDNLPP